jgi:hypothetical protein
MRPLADNWLLDWIASTSSISPEPNKGDWILAAHYNSAKRQLKEKSAEC